MSQEKDISEVTKSMFEDSNPKKAVSRQKPDSLEAWDKDDTKKFWQAIAKKKAEEKDDESLVQWKVEFY